MTSYNIDQFSKITNIPKLNLRTWENRYSYLVPSRTDTNIRVYSDSLLVRGINTKLLLENGHKISNSLFQPPSSFQTYIKGVPLCVMIGAQMLIPFLGGCVLGLWFILKLNNYGDVCGGCVL